MEALEKDDQLAPLIWTGTDRLFHRFGLGGGVRKGSFVPEEVEFATRQYQGHTREISTLLNQLFEFYQLEGLDMPYTMEDFRKDYVREHLGILSTHSMNTFRDLSL